MKGLGIRVAALYYTIAAFFNAPQQLGDRTHHLPPWGVTWHKGILGVGENGNKTLTLYPKYGMRADFFQTQKIIYECDYLNSSYICICIEEQNISKKKNKTEIDNWIVNSLQGSSKRSKLSKSTFWFDQHLRGVFSSQRHACGERKTVIIINQEIPSLFWIDDT